MGIVRGRRSHRNVGMLDIPYVSGGATTQKLDLYYPTTGEVPFRCMIVVHGGGWQSGDKSLPGTSHAFGELKTSGIVVCSINYRLSTTDAWPAQIYDAKAAVRWLRANATAYGIDPWRIGIWGVSAGGLLAALVGATGTGVLTDTSLGNASTSEEVKCAVAWQTPSYFPDEDADFVTQASAGGAANGRGYAVCSTSSEEAELFGGVGAGINPCSGGGLTKSTEASPRTYLSATTSCRRWLHEHGDQDATVPSPQATAFHNACVAAGLSSTLRIAAGKAHTGSDWNGDSTLRAATVAWISANL